VYNCYQLEQQIRASLVTYSLDFRKKVLSVKKKENLSIRKVAERFYIAYSSVCLWLKKLEPIKKRKRTAYKIDMDALKRDIKEHPDAYQYERAERLGVSKHGIWQALKRLNVSYQKKSLPPESGSRKKIYLLP
jgi:transposase